MKHAYLIMAHNEPSVLRFLLEALDYETNHIFIHIDSKADLSQFGDISKICKRAQCNVLNKRIDVCWGGFSIVRCELLLYKTAYNTGHFDYYHLLSGTTLPIKPHSEINRVFENNKGKEFIGFYDRTKEHIEERVKYYYFNDGKFPRKFKRLSGWFNHISLTAQRLIHVDRSVGIDWKKGSEWCSLSSSCVELIISKEHWIKKHFKYAFCGDEIYKQTIIWNSNFKNSIFQKVDITKSNLVEISFTGIDKSHPTIIQKKDINKLLSSVCLFSRKFSGEYPEAIQELKRLISEKQ